MPFTQLSSPRDEMTGNDSNEQKSLSVSVSGATGIHLRCESSGFMNEI